MGSRAPQKPPAGKVPCGGSNVEPPNETMTEGSGKVTCNVRLSLGASVSQVATAMRALGGVMGGRSWPDDRWKRYTEACRRNEPQPIPWPRVWWYAWRIAAMLAWAGGWWLLAELV
jgi:hypothetical protein